MKTLEELYGLEKKQVSLERVKVPSGRWLELFRSPGDVRIEIKFPEFTCKCPRTGQPDFATIEVIYEPHEWCVELKSLKYYFNSFRDEGHFHEEVICIIFEDLKEVLKPKNLKVRGIFNVRGGTYPVIQKET